MYQVRTAEVFVTEYTEDEVNQRSGGLDIRVLYKSGRIETGEGEFVHELFQWYTVLETNGNRDRETVHHAAHGSAFLGHINKDLTQGTITIFTGTKEDGLSVDLGFLGKPAAFGRQGPSFHDTGQFAFQFGIRRSLYSFLYFFQQFFYG